MHVFGDSVWAGSIYVRGWIVYGGGAGILRRVLRILRLPPGIQGMFGRTSRTMNFRDSRGLN